MPKRKARKAAKVEDPVTDAKLEALGTLLATFKQQATEYEAYLNAVAEEACEQIEKMYQEKLKSIPEHIRKMTVSQIMELQAKESRNGVNPETPDRYHPDTIRSVFERNKQATDKKKTQKKDKKRSLSASQSRPLVPGREAAESRISRTLSESSLFTPLAKQPRLQGMVVTPKFNPKLPVSRMARRPRADEIVMSLSGSPLQCYPSEVSLSLGGGKILTFDNGGVVVNKDNGAVVNKNFIKELDEPIIKTLENVKNQLEQILKS